MPSQTKEIINYAIRIHRRVNRTFSADAKNVDYNEWIYCNTADKKVVRLFFLTNRDVPPKSFITKGGNFYTFFKEDQYTYCLDLLRNERPIKVDLYPDDGNIRLRCGTEPVGEGPGEFEE